MRRIKEGTSAVLLQSGLMKNGGLFIWSAVAICETYKNSWRMGKHLTKGASENHLKARYAVWCNAEMSMDLCERPVKAPPHW